MAVNYDKLWKLLDERKITKSTLRDSIGASQSTIVRMGKNEFVSLEVIDKICKSLNCFPDDIIGYAPDSVSSEDDTATQPQIMRGDIYYANLNEGVASEQDGLRPVLIVQNNTANKHSSSVIVVAISSKKSRAKLPTQVVITSDDQTCLMRESVVLCEQFRTISKTRLTDKLGAFSDKIMDKVDTAMMVALNLTK